MNPVISRFRRHPTSRRAGIALLACCALGLTACGGAPAGGPNTGVTVPNVGRPPLPDAIAAVLAKQAFTPYAELGNAADDGLAPDESFGTLTKACLTDAGYPNAVDTGVVRSVRIGDTLTAASAFGPFGYVGRTTAAQDGFQPGGGGLGRAPNFPTGAAAVALQNCETIVVKFQVAQQNSALAGIQSLGDAITTADQKDPAVVTATKAWSACMAANGYPYPDPLTLVKDQLRQFHVQAGGAKGGVIVNGPDTGLTAAQQAAQLALAEADESCTESTDLAGIYFAVQASYEQQIVDANQRQLNSAVQQYRTAYQQALNGLTGQLATMPSTLSPHGG